MEGYLQSWTNYVFGWQKRYFVLEKGILSYCKDKSSPLRGLLHLDTSSVYPHRKNPLRFSVETGMSSVHLKASSREEASEWMQVISKMQESRRQQDSIKESKLEAIHTSVGEIWSLHAEMQAEIDILPKHLKRSIPGLDRLLALCQDIKIVSSEAARYLDYDEKPTKQVVPLEEAFSDGSLSDYEDAYTHMPVEETHITHRRCLPVLRNPQTKVNIWKVIKDSIGQDLSKIAVPVYFNEPLSMLQRLSEDMIYSDLVLKASSCEDSTQRMAWVACFVVSYLHSSIHRIMKPFNPLLGETFELERDGFRLVTEQVSHHPPIGAIHVQHPEFEYWGSIEIRSKFKATYLQVTPFGKFHLLIHKYQDHFLWEKPMTNVHNLVFGQMYMNHIGEVKVQNIKTGDSATLQFDKGSWFGNSSQAISGLVQDASGAKKHELKGDWSKHLRMINLTTAEEILAWEIHPYPDAFDFNYFFSDYTLQLNLPPECFKNLPPTDSRYRPDQRALENGDIDLAGSEKHRLEEKQRSTRRALEAQGSVYKPNWFEMVNQEWNYKGNYWESKDAGFTNLPDIM